MSELNTDNYFEKVLIMFRGRIYFSKDSKIKC